MSPSRFSHDDADGQRDLQALVAIGDHYEQEAAPPDTDGSLRDLHQKAAQNLSSVVVKPEPERVPSHDHAVERAGSRPGISPG